MIWTFNNVHLIQVRYIKAGTQQVSVYDHA